MNKSSIILLILLITTLLCNGYEYPKPKLIFNSEDLSPTLTNRKIVRGVFFYTYDDNYDGREVEMHELNPETFNKLISSKDYIKAPTALKSTFDLIAFFDGRCETSINCERIQQDCRSTPLPRTTISKTTASKSSSTTTTKPLTTTTSQQTTTTPWPSNYELQKEVSNIFLDFAPQLTEPHLIEIMTALKNMNAYTQYWTASQVDEISSRNSLIVQSEMLKQNTSGTASVMRFSDEIKQYMINYTKEINPNMSLEEILGMISIVEEIGTATMRYLTFDQYKGLRGPVVSAFANNTVINGFVSTTKAPTTTTSSTTTTTKKLTIPTSSTVKKLTTTTTKSPTTLTVATTTQKPASTTKTYIPPPGSSRKPYTHWAGTYRQYSGYYSFGYTWKPFTGGYSWRSRRYTSGTTTTTQRYGQKGLDNTFNPLRNK
ncbi:hypothetical protein ACKWTF_016198 [Chironomus riparius]